jgi:hypothetical protein
VEPQKQIGISRPVFVYQVGFEGYGQNANGFAFWTAPAPKEEGACPALLDERPTDEEESHPRSQQIISRKTGFLLAKTQANCLAWAWDENAGANKTPAEMLEFCYTAQVGKNYALV